MAPYFGYRMTRVYGLPGKGSRRLRCWTCRCSCCVWLTAWSWSPNRTSQSIDESKLRRTPFKDPEYFTMFFSSLAAIFKVHLRPSTPLKNRISDKNLQHQDRSLPNWNLLDGNQDKPLLSRALVGISDSCQTIALGQVLHDVLYVFADRLEDAGHFLFQNWVELRVLVKRVTFMSD